jgi:hypothetical protein
VSNKQKEPSVLNCAAKIIKECNKLANFDKRNNTLLRKEGWLKTGSLK